MKFVKPLFLLIIMLLVIPLLSARAASETPIIRAVLFYSPTCPHCVEVMERVLPPLVEAYPEQLDIVGIDVTHPVGGELYQKMLTELNVPDERLGVPSLVVGSTLLVGTNEIETNFPALIKVGLSTGGFNWPNIDGLESVLEAQSDPAAPLSPSAFEAPHTINEQNPGFIDRFNQDPLANSIAVIVLLGMIAAGAIVIVSYLQGPDRKFIQFPDWVIPVLSVLGLGVALYLTYVEVTNANAVCGPVGNCNSVQQSSYAKLFGILPVGLLGAGGYLAILAAWLVQKFGPANYKKISALIIWGMAWFGVLFSIYLTFLEPFVIGATCAWCISSAILITLILLASTSNAKEALRIQYDDEEEAALDNEDLAGSEGMTVSQET